MQEVQFVSDFTVNLIERLSDYDPKRIPRYYAEYDETFPQEDDLADRMERIFEKLVALPLNDFTDTIFNSAQITFSLMYLLDENRNTRIGTDRIHDAIRRTDALVTAAKEEERGFDPQIVAGFAAGNLHRIRTRQIRHEILGQHLGL